MSNNKEIIKRIQEIVPSERVLVDEPMSNHTTFKIGGPADAFVIVNDEKELERVMKLLDETEHLLIGNGSNFLVADEGYPGVMVKLDGKFDDIKLSDDSEIEVIAGGAKLLSSVSAFIADRELTGFEFASGIPGSIGGAVFMNAGAYGGEMKDVVKSVRMMKPDGSEIKEFSNEEMGFAYRYSRVQEDKHIVLSVSLKLEKGNKKEIENKIKELQDKRNEKQPINYPSAGSTFKRPAGGFAAALIDQAGLSGSSVGAAQVSPKHCGFIVNNGGATAEDVLELMRLVRKTVYEKSGIMLEPEVRLINCEL